MTEADIARRLADARRVFDDVDLFIAPSRSLAQEFVVLGLDSSKIRVSDYGFPHLSRPARAPSGARLRIGFVGTLTWHKGAHVLLDAVRRLPKDTYEVQILDRIIGPW